MSIGKRATFGRVGLIAGYTEIVGINPRTQPLGVLPPVVVGIGDIFVALGMSAHRCVEIGEIARIGEDRYEKYPAGEDENESSHDAPRRVIAVMALPVVKDSLGSEDIEEGENREEMSKTDVEIAGDAEVAVEADKSEHGILRDMRLEGMSKYATPRLSASPVFIGNFDDATESVEESEAEYGEEWQCGFHEEDDGKVECGRLVGDRAEEVVRIAAGDACKHHEDAEEILRERFHERNLTHADDS